MSCQSLVVQPQLAYPKHQTYNFLQLCYLYLHAFNKGFKKSFQNCEAAIDIQSKGLLGVVEEYIPACLRNVCDTNSYCKESRFLHFLL